MTLEEVRDELVTLGVVRDGLGDTRVGSGRVVGPSWRSGKGRWSLGNVRNELGDPRGGPRRFVRLSVMSGTGRRTRG